MKAILVNEDKSLRWDNVPDPVIKCDEVLVKIEAVQDILYCGENVGKVVLTVD